MHSHGSYYNGIPKEISTYHMAMSPWKGYTLFEQNRKKSVWEQIIQIEPSKFSYYLSRLRVVVSQRVRGITSHAFKKEVETVVWSLSRGSTGRLKSRNSQNSLGLGKKVCILLYKGADRTTDRLVPVIQPNSE